MRLRGGIIELRNQLEKIKRGKKVKVSILEGNLVGKENQLWFQDNSKILDDLLNSQRPPSIKSGLGFHET